MQEAERLQGPVARSVGDWRVLYIVDDAAMLVNIMRIAHRREVYE